MLIESFYMHNLQNEEHLQFHAECRNLLEVPGLVNASIAAVLPPYLESHNLERRILAKMRKSSITDELSTADTSRDELITGFQKQVDAAAHHYLSDLSQAGSRLWVAFGHYGDVARKSYDAETADIVSLLSLLNKSYASDIALLGLGGWLAELELRNQAFIGLMQSRYSEEVAKVQGSMKEVRVSVDDAFRSIVTHLNAFMTLQGDEGYGELAKSVNTRIQHYRLLLAQRKGRNAARASKEDNGE
ncbi:MAG: DUF6261 family protein [Bacteroidota bacterium]